MEIKPVGKTEKPKYPLKNEVAGETLKNSVPKRWASSAAAKAALAALAAATLTGCTPLIPTAGVPLPPSATSESSFATPDVSVFAGVPMIAKVNVAPLFEHGDGRGAFGCMMIAPPVFLSEEDALTVINEAAKEYGLSFSAENTPDFYNVRQPVTDLNPLDISNSPQPSGTDNYVTYKTDFADNEYGIAIEFVSTEDVKKWSSGISGASVEDYDTKNAANQLSDSLEESYDGSFNTVAVLYDPLELFRPESISADSEEWKHDEIKTREMSEQQLKAQATDFFNWLKSQGII